MDDPAYIVSKATCGKCQYFSREHGFACCNYTLIVGKARPLEPIAQCTVKIEGKRMQIQPDWKGITGREIVVCME